MFNQTGNTLLNIVPQLRLDVWKHWPHPSRDRPESAVQAPDGQPVFRSPAEMPLMVAASA